MGRRVNSNPIAPPILGMHHLRRCWASADPEDRRLGISYYATFRQRILTATKLPAELASTAVGLFAALSPNNTESNTLHDVQEAVVRYRDECWERFRPTTYHHNVEKAWRILNGEDPDLVLTGLKTNAFYHCLLDPSDPTRPVCVDGHMVNVWNGKRQPLDSAGITRSEYNMIAGGVRQVAAEINQNANGGAGNQWPFLLLPCQLQSTVWLTWRRMMRILYKPQYELELELNETR